jgi:hypothetical protein
MRSQNTLTFALPGDKRLIPVVSRPAVPAPGYRCEQMN